MSRRAVLAVAGLAGLVGGWALTRHGLAGRVQPPAWSQSRLAYSEDLNLVFVSHRDASLVVALDASTGAKAWEAKVGRLPRNLDLVHSGGGASLLVSCEGSGEVWILDPATGAERGRLAVGPGPRGFATFNRRFLAVALYPIHQLAIWDLGARRPIGRISAGRFPSGVAVAPAQRTLYVTNFFSGEILAFEWDGFRPLAALKTPPKANQLSTLVAVDGGTRLMIPHVVVNNDQPDLHLANTLFPVVSLVGTDSTATTQLDLAFVDRPVNGPEAVALLPARKLIISVNSRSNDLSVIDRDSSLAAGHVPVGKYPLGIAVDGAESRAFVVNAHEHTVSVVDLRSLSEVERWPYGEEVLPPKVARGRDFFHDADSVTMVLNQWLSCSNCHPEGHSDGLVWRLPGRPPLRTKDLHEFGSTRPGGWLASFDEMQDEEHFIRDFFLGNGLSPKPPFQHLGPPNEGLSEDLDALAEYVYSLRFEPSPFLEGGRLSAAAERGRALFQSEEVGCQECHPAPRYTVSSLGSVRAFSGLLDPELAPLPAVDVPALLGLYVQPRYLHDARAGTLTEVFRRWNASDRHGRTRGLSGEELADLEAFLLSLPFEEGAPAERGDHDRRVAGGV